MVEKINFFKYLFWSLRQLLAFKSPKKSFEGFINLLFFYAKKGRCAILQLYIQTVKVCVHKPLKIVVGANK